MFATLGVPVTSFRVLRDAVTFLAGLALAGYEVITAEGEPSLIVLGLAATMMGLPGTLGVDRLLNRGGPPDEPPGPPAQAVPDPPATRPAPPSSRRHGR